MRVFLILCCCSLTLAAPGSYGYESSSHADYASALPMGYDYSANSVETESSAHAAEGYQSYQVQHTPIVTKRFYIHSAPQDEEDEHEQRTLVVGRPRKNYNVVFVKAPTSGAKKTTLKITPAVNEEKTVVYVLSQKSKSPEIDAQVYHAAEPTHKPEVFFIKYETEEEAAHAQQNIQSQYDHLGGATQITHEGVPQVQSVIGAVDGSHAHTSAHLGSNKYLPPVKK